MFDVFNTVNGETLSSWSHEAWASQEVDRLIAFGYNVALSISDEMPLDDEWANLNIDEPYVLQTFGR